MVEALEHGVTIPLTVSTRVSRHYGRVARLERDHDHQLEIRYLPMLRAYQLSDLSRDRQDNYPRLAMLIDDLSRPRSWSTSLTPPEARERDWQVEIRAELDRDRLPSPMRLPAQFDSDWRARTPWQTWRVDAGGRGAD